MDYNKLAAQYGGSIVPDDQQQQPDFASLAAQFGGAVQPQQPDFASLAAQFGGAAKPAEEGNIIDYAANALKQRVQSFVPAAKLYFGVGDQEQATKDLARTQSEADNAYKETQFGDIGKEYKAGNYGEALSKTVDKFKEVAGSSFGSMAPAIAAGEAGSMVAGPLGGIAAFGLTALGSYLADNIGRQKQENPNEDIHRLKATAAATGQAALDVLGFKFFKPLGALVGLEGKGLAEKTAEEIVQAATNPGAYKTAVAKGIAEGIAFEVPQEVAQQVLERWQAGLPLDPFNDPSAAQEYLDAAGGALMLGPAFGAFSTVAETRAARQQAAQAEQQKQIEAVAMPQQEGQMEEPPAPTVPAGEVDPAIVAYHEQQLEAQNKSAGWNLTPEEIKKDALELATKEAEDNARAESKATGAENAAGPITEPVGASVPVAEQPNQVVAPAGAGVAEPNGVVPVGENVEHAPSGEVNEPTAVKPPEEPKLIAEGHTEVAPKQTADEAMAKYEGLHGATRAGAIRGEISLAERVLAAANKKGNQDAASQAQADINRLGELLPEAEKRDKADSLNSIQRQMLGSAKEELDSAIANGTLSEEEANKLVEEARQTGDAGTASEVIHNAIDEAEQVNPELSGKPTADVAEAVSPIALEPGTVTAEEVAPAKPETRGRKPLPEEQKAAAAERDKESTKAWKAIDAQTNAAVEALHEATTELDPSDYPDIQQFQEGLESQRLRKIQAIKSLLQAQKSAVGKPKLTEKIKAALAHESITPKEIADVKEGMQRASKSSTEVKVGRADTRFSKFNNAQQALRHVVSTGNAFQKFLAQRLLPFVKDVKFTVIEEGEHLPAVIRDGGAQEDWDLSRGLFLREVASGQRHIFVRGISGGPSQGINNVTVLHEVLHAALNKKLEMGLDALKEGFDRHSDIGQAMQAFLKTIKLAHNRALELADKNELPEFMHDLTGAGIWDDPKEFLAYAMTDPRFQKFLMESKGHIKESLFTRFVDGVRRFFGMASDTVNGLSDVINITDKMLSARMTPIMQAKLQLERAEAKGTSEVSSQVKKTQKKQADELAKVEKSDLAESLQNGTLKDLIKLRSNEELVDALGARVDAFKLSTLREFLPTLMTDTLTTWADRLNIKGLSEAWTKINDMEAWRSRRTKTMGEIATRLGDLKSNNEEMYRKLAGIMHYSTLMEVDPTGKHANTALTRMWNGLNPEAKKLYTDVRDFYRDSYEMYYAGLGEQINRMGLPPEDKEKIMAGIKQMYEEGLKIQPYFPLMRYGQYWARIGKGAKSEFHMFESLTDRNVFLRKHARDAGSTVDQMMEDQDIDVGNNLSSAKTGESSQMLKEIFGAINAAMKPIVDDQGNVTGNNIKAEQIKGEIYQMFLQSLPERSFRKKFIHRQGKAGFSADIHRNFVTTSSSMTNQVARVTHSHEILNQLDRAADIIKGNPDKAKLSEFVNEMRMRAERELYPPAEQDTATEAASRLLTTSAFLWMMSSVKTAVAQFSAIPVFVAPVLYSRHGLQATAGALGKYLNVFNGIGVKDAQGNWSAPTIGNVKGLSANQQKAVQYMKDRGISDVTMAFDIAGRRNLSTTQYQSTTRKVARGVASVLTGLFHHSERMIREVAFMSSYDLNAKNHSHEEALKLAEKETHYMLNNYHTGNKPRGIGQDASGKVRMSATAPLNRAVLQFKMFPAFVTTYFVRNAWRMTKDLDPAVRKEARKQFLGSMGMSFAIAGTMGVPGFSFAMGILQGILHAIEGDDEDDLEKRDLEMWFRNKWLPDTFGGVKVGGHSLDEILDRGVVASMTGFDITSSLSLNNMWFPEMKESATAQAQMLDYFVSMAGPGVSLAFKQIPQAVDYFHKGDVMRGMEQLMPAMVRSPLTAARYAREGATTASGAVIKDASEFTTGQLIGQSLGFSSEGLQARREDIFRLEGMKVKAKQDKSAALTRFEKEVISGSDSGLESALDKVDSYNSRNWFDPITGAEINDALKRRMKQRFDQGFPIDKKFYPLVMDLLEPSSKKLEREAAK